jgi:predicted DNA binding CopG/RHH family protein
MDIIHHMVRNTKTPLDYLGERGELVPVQVRLPKDLVERVKARLGKHNMTFTELVRGACHWYLEIPEETIADKKRRPQSD